MVTNSHEEWVARLTAVLAKGLPLDLGAGAAIDVDAIWPWPPTQRIPASALRAALVTLPEHVDPRGLIVRGAWIDGVVDLEHAHIPFPVTFNQCVLPAGVRGQECRIKSLTVTHSRTGSIDLDGSQIEGSLSFVATEVLRVSASHASIRGRLDLKQATLSNSRGKALDLDGADIKGDLDASDRFRATGEVRALGATIGGHLNLNGAILRNPGGDALSLDEADIKCNLHAPRLDATGQVRAIGATIGGQLNLNGATLSNSRGKALDLDGADIKGGLFARFGFNATGQVRAHGATIGGQLNLSGATLSNPCGAALSLDVADIKHGGLNASGLTATGEVRAIGATIGGELNLNGAILKNPCGDALNLDVADIKGNLHASGGFNATGQVRAHGATISGQMNLNGATLSKPDGDALSLVSANIGTLLLHGITSFGGNLGLTSCQMGDLVVDEEPPRLSSATGWRVRDIKVLNPIKEATTRRNETEQVVPPPAAVVRWLDTSTNFTASPWEEIARFYDRNGQPADARRVRWEAARRSARQAPGYSKPIRCVYGLLVGYGYYPLIAAAWLLGVVLLAATLTANNPDAFLPTGTTARPTTAVAASEGCPTPPTILTAATDARCLTPGYPELQPITYALATVTPASAITQPAWAPLAPGAAWLEAFLTVLKILGWLLTALLLAGLTGLLRKG